MRNTTRPKLNEQPKVRSRSGTQDGARTTRPPRASQGLAELAAAIRTRLVGSVHGASQRVALSELERFERAIVRWTSVPPSEAQIAAMLEQLLALQERVERLDTKLPVPKTTTKLPRSTSVRTPTTVKLPRATTTSKPSRQRGEP